MTEYKGSMAIFKQKENKAQNFPLCSLRHPQENTSKTEKHEISFGLFSFVQFRKYFYPTG
jgi:hypothetical protein